MKLNLGVLAFALVFPMTGLAQTAAKCKFVRDPTIPISASGTWCLTASIVGRGLLIDADDVVLDLRGYSIINDGTATTPVVYLGTEVAGVLAENHNNITVRNGTIRGFDYGVQLGFPGGARGNVLVENLLVLNSKARGINVLVYDTVTVRNNTVSGVAGRSIYGISARGRNDVVNNLPNLSVLIIQNNRVHDVHGNVTTGAHLSAGIAAWSGNDTVISGNVVTDTFHDSASSQISGIDVRNEFPQTSLISGNVLLNSHVDRNTFGVGSSQHMGTPAYTGPIEIFGNITGNRVYNFDTGVTASASINENGKPKFVITSIVGQNVSSGARAGRAFMGGQQYPTNRIE